MQGIYTYISETKNVPWEYSVSAILSLLFMVPISLVPALALLYFYVSTFRSTRSVRNVSDRIFLCEHLMDYNLARLHEPTLNLSAHA